MRSCARRPRSRACARRSSGCSRSSRLIVAAVGVYGVVGYLVGQRTQEIAVRLALGARRRTVLAWMVWEGLRPVSLGLIAGVAASVAGRGSSSGMLFGVTATDLPTYAAVVALLFAIACGAVLIPARRATRVDPMTALRAE